jgi:hypothetical protein
MIDCMLCTDIDDVTRYIMSQERLPPGFSGGVRRTTVGRSKHSTRKPITGGGLNQIKCINMNDKIFKEFKQNMIANKLVDEKDSNNIFVKGGYMYDLTPEDLRSITTDYDIAKLYCEYSVYNNVPDYKQKAEKYKSKIKHILENRPELKKALQSDILIDEKLYDAHLEQVDNLHSILPEKSHNTPETQFGAGSGNENTD